MLQSETTLQTTSASSRPEETAAVDADRLAGDIAAGIREQERHRRGDVGVGVAVSSEGVVVVHGCKGGGSLRVRRGVEPDGQPKLAAHSSP